MTTTAAQIRTAAVKANRAAQRAWKRGGDCVTYRAAMAELPRLCAAYEALTDEMLMV